MKNEAQVANAGKYNYSSKIPPQKMVYLISRVKLKREATDVLIYYCHKVKHSFIHSPFSK